MPSSIDRQIFAATPGNCALLLPDAPRFTIVAVTDGYVQISGRTREELIGKGLLEAFPAAAEEVPANSENRLREFLLQVVNKKEINRLPLHRYDIQKEDGSYDERYWSAVNNPVLNDEGELLYIIHSVEDVTMKIKSAQHETTLKDIQKTLDFFLHAPYVIGLAKGENHVLQLANETAFQLWGKGPEMIGKPLVESLPELEEQGILELFDQVKRNRQPYIANELPLVLRRNGKEEVRYFNLIYQPYYEENAQEPTGVFTISHDITEQVVTRKQIEESEQRFRALVTTTANVVYRMNPDWSEMRELKGMGFLTDAGEPTKDWLNKYIHRNDHPLVKEAIQKASEMKGVFELEHRVVRQDGTPGWAFSRAIPILDSKGEVIEWFGAAHDITHRKQTEEALQATTAEIEKQKRLYEAITSNTPDLIYVFDLNYRFSYVNEALLTMWGKSWDEAIGRGLPENGYEDWHTEMHHREIDQVVATKQPIRGEVSFPHAVLGRRLYDYIFVPVINEAGEVEAVAGTTRDITEIKKAEEVLKQNSEKLEALVAERTRELQRSNKELEEFAYAASHDMKEPIRKIHFFTDRLKERLQTKLEEEDRRYFERLEIANRRMTSLIDDLLLYSHVSRGPGPAERVDLNQTLAFVLDDLELHIEEKGAAIKVGSLPTINGQERQLQQLFENLLGNALKYSKPDETPQINISCKQVKGSEMAREKILVDPDKTYHLIRVSDNGIGFPQEDAERIFNVFTRLHGNSEYRGTGVGLSIAQKVVQNHDGCIWAESAEGKGATFTILLPAS